MYLECPDLCFPSPTQDYFTNANKELEKDAQQDYHLDYAMENSTHTVIEFTRELHTCDANDKIITVRRVRVNTLMGGMCFTYEAIDRIKGRDTENNQYRQSQTILGKFLNFSFQTPTILKP